MSRPSPIASRSSCPARPARFARAARPVALGLRRSLATGTGLAVRVILAVALLAAAVPSVRADPAGAEGGPALLARAQMALDALRYEEAAALLDRAWRAGGNRPAELALIHRLAGSVAVILGHDAEADAAFRRLVALAPDSSLPDGTSPKISGRLDAARAALAGRPLRVEVVTRAGPARDSGPVIVVEVLSDPARMVAGMRVHYRDTDGAAHVRGARGPASLAVELPRSIAAPVQIEVLDAHGNILVEEELRTAPTPIGTAARARATRTARTARATGAPDGDDGDDGDRTARSTGAAGPSSTAGLDTRTDTRTDTDTAPPLLARGLPWAAASVGLGAVGLFFGLRSESAQDELDELNRDSADHDFRDALAVEDRLRRDSRIANVAFVATGATAAVAAVLWIREWRRSRRSARAGRPRDARLPAPLLGPIGLTWTIPF